MVDLIFLLFFFLFEKLHRKSNLPKLNFPDLPPNQFGRGVNNQLNSILKFFLRMELEKIIINSETHIKNYFSLFCFVYYLKVKK